MGVGDGAQHQTSGARNCTPENLEIPDLMLRIAPE
jgi:hypothetical protein